VPIFSKIAGGKRDGAVELGDELAEFGRRHRLRGAQLQRQRNQPLLGAGSELTSANGG